ncbi:MAG: arginine--tRNA ligase, partial [Chloroflexi bacterium]|nr:arginine--tRNA ligase [Chloroflexota bacterium]
MLKHKIATILEQAAAEAQQKGLLPQVGLPDITLEHPQNAAHGDYASSLPLKLARAVRAKPLDIAEIVAKLIVSAPEVEKIDVAPPGFINFSLSGDWLAQQVEVILKQGERYGNIDSGQGLMVQLEFVSVNPTGPLHVGHGRGAVLGDTLANVLEAAGYTVEKEYYVNDAGNQMDAFYRSLHARYQQVLGLSAEMPSDGYQGEYVIELAREIVSERGDSLLHLAHEEATAEIGKMGLRRALDSIREDLELLGVEFDVWFSEQSLFDSGQYQKTMSLLQQGGYTVEKEGAVWVASSEMGEDKDNVLVRSSGAPTYFASDIAYHYSKFLERGFNRVIDIWGADHQGHVPRMKAVVKALGIDPARLEIIITQMVTLKRGDVEIKLSKRSGELVTLRELVEEVGPDACRFFFLSRSADSQMDFDLELAKKESADNPVYYVQYAHARIASILRLADDRDIDYQDGDVALLITEPELTLIRKMIQLEEIIELVADSLEPHHLPYYAQDLATVFHSFYKQCRVISDDQALTAARLKLVEASRIVFARALHFMGMNAPEQ